MKGKTSVVLTKDIENIGKKDEVVVVRDGFLLNYLIPNKAAEVADSAALERVAASAVEKLEEQKSARIAAEELKTKLEGAGTVTISKKVGEEGKLFGSVSASDVLEALGALSGETLGALKVMGDYDADVTGTYDAQIKLHPDVTASIQVEITAES